MANEAEFLEKVRAGIFRVDPDGSIWRLKQMTRSGAAVSIIPRRAETGTVRGYRMVRLSKGRSILAHRAVFVALKGPLGPDQELNHLDGKRDHNAPSNLEIATRRENCQHSYDVLKRWRPIGVLNGSAKLTPEKAAEIMALKGRETSREIASRYGVSKTTITGIWNGRLWRPRNIDQAAAS